MVSFDGLRIDSCTPLRLCSRVLSGRPGTTQTIAAERVFGRSSSLASYSADGLLATLRDPELGAFFASTRKQLITSGGENKRNKLVNG
jgi:hypothetical protein